MSNDEAAIRSALEAWTTYRDTAQWDAFATVWHPQGRMVATWFQASAPEFIARCQKAWAGGMRSFHVLGGAQVTIQGSRAISQNRMQIIQRAMVHDVLVDVTCLGRFWDAWEKVDGEWKMRLRQPIYEMDSMVIVDPQAKLVLDQDLLSQFPEGYQHLAYLQTKQGFDVRRDLPGTRSPAIETITKIGQAYLAGEPASVLDAI